MAKKAKQTIKVSRKDKFAFGVWCVMNAGHDPFGPPTRPEMTGLEAIKSLGEREVYGFEYHDDDLWPIGASAVKKRNVVQQAKKIM